MRWTARFFTSILQSFILSILALLPAFAHVGSPGVLVQKEAGKYRVLVSVTPPDVVPGTAKVTLLVQEGRVRQVLARPVYFQSGDEGSPVHDELTEVEPGRFEGVVWLMDSGSSSVQLEFDGPDGKATMIAPVVAMATAVRTMPESTGAILLALGALLVVLMITIVGASLSDGTLRPGDTPSPAFRRKRFVGMGIGTVLMALALVGWRSWWDSEAQNYLNYNLYRPLPMKGAASVGDNGPVLDLRLDTTGFAQNWGRRRNLSYILPDHGKLMHVFLVRTPGLDAFAHLHPDRRDTTWFQAPLPNLPGGKYLVYADVVYRTGFTETLTDTVELPAIKQSAVQAAARRLDPDDSYLIAPPMGVKAEAVGVPHLDDDMVLCGVPSASFRLADGATMFWNDKPASVLTAGKLYTLKFSVADPQGKAAPLEPYLGMGGHAAVVRSDGSVYIHLHPVGTYSMAAEESLSGRIADTARTFRYPDPKRFRDSVDTFVASLKTMPEAQKNKLLMAAMPSMQHAGKPMAVNNMVEFPYAFPRPGHSRIWVQVKRNGVVQTGVFDAQVKE